MKSLFLLVVFSAFGALFADKSFAEGNPDAGMLVFHGQGKCKLCHNLTDKKKVGPGLKGVTERHSERWLKLWLADPQKMWEGDDPETVQLKKWNPARTKKPKTAMKINKLKDKEITDIIAFFKKNDAS